jgi:3-hydroxybutyrate dehydrogenase
LNDTGQRNILITGAASGIGRALAVQLAAAGHRLLLADLSEDGLSETAALLPAGSGVPLPMDVTSAQQIEAALADRPVDVLVNNAGLQHVSPLEDFSEAKWDLLVGVLLKGPFLLTRAVLPGMRRRNFGRVIHIGSIHSLVASPYKAAYVSAKHGLLGLAKTVALETKNHDITVNTVCPAYVRTPLVDKQIQDQMKAHGLSEAEVIAKIFLEPMPKSAFITVEEIAAAVLFLMSPLARNITGQTLTIDGGWTAR